MVQHGATWCNMVQQGATGCNMVQHGVKWCTMVQHGATLCNMVQHGATWCKMVQDVASWCKLVSQIPLNMSLRFVCFLRNCVLPQAKLSSRDGGSFSHEINLQDCQNNLFQILNWGFRFYTLVSSSWAQFSDQVSWTKYHQRLRCAALYTVGGIIWGPFPEPLAHLGASRRLRSQKCI